MFKIQHSPFVLGVAVLASACLAVADQPPATRPAKPGAATQAVVQIKGEVPKDFIEHRVGDTGASLRAPPGWKLLPAKKANRVTLVDQENGAVMLFEAMAPEPGGTPAGDAETIGARLRAATPGFKLVSSDVVRLHEKEAWRIVYDAKREGKAPARNYQVFVHAKKHHYMLVCTTKPEAAEGIYPVLEQILLSAKLP